MDAPRDILDQRMRNQRLIGAPFASPEAAVGRLLAVQSQDFPVAKWGVGQRVKNATDASLDRAYKEGRILRTHVMRPTWHFVLPDDIGWLLELTAPRVRKLMAYYDRGLEIDANVRRKSAKVLAKALRDRRHLTRAEISRAHAEAGIEAAGQRLGHIVMHAELDGLVCSGPMRGKQFTYALVDERAPEARRLSPEEALAELVLRFFRGHGPATVKDCAWWSGLTQADVRAGIDLVTGPLQSDTIAGTTYYFGSTGRIARTSRPLVRLLPNYDEYLIAYRDQSLFLDRGRVPPIRNDALAAHFVVLNGEIVGGWRRTLTPDGVQARVESFGKFDRTKRAVVRQEFARYGRFLGKQVSIEVV